jgi:hypothetical protein
MMIALSVKKSCAQRRMLGGRLWELCHHRCRGVRVVVDEVYTKSASRLGGWSARQEVGRQHVQIVVLYGRQIVSVEDLDCD